MVTTGTPGLVSKLLGDDRRVSAGRLAGVLYLLASLYQFGTMPFVPAEQGLRVVASGLIVTLCGVGLILAPWRRWPGWAPRLTLPLTLVIVGFGLGPADGSLGQYTVLFSLGFVWIGLTQPPRTSLRWSPLVLVTVVPLLLSGTAAQAADLVGVLFVTMAIGELLAVLLAHLHRRQDQLHALLTATRRLLATTDEQEAGQVAVALAQTLLAADGVIIATRLAGKSVVMGLAESGSGIDPTQVRIDLDREVSGVGTVMRSGKPLFVPDTSTSDLVSRGYVNRTGARSALMLPLPGEGGQLGALVCFWRTERREVDEYAEQAIEVLTSQLGQVLESHRATRTWRDRAQTDALTGLANRPAFQATLDDLREQDTVAVLDLDLFKDVNDNGGHHAGDVVLRSFAAVIAETLRATDTAARLGGDEFAVIFPGTTPEAAHASLERIRRRWSGTEETVTFSAGVAGHQRGRTPRATMAAADAACYDAKRRGRDQVRHEEPAVDAVGSASGAR